MLAGEKQRLLGLLDHERHWCKHVEAQDAQGRPVQLDDDAAAAWDLTGAVCRLFGWGRAGVLYRQLDRHIHGRRRTLGWPQRHLELDAMAALQSFNDRSDTTFDILRARLESMPVWSRGGSNGTIEPEQGGYAHVHVNGAPSMDV
jgi:hypothetical protein